MLLVGPLLVLLPLLLLADAVLALVALGPAGWLAAAALVAGVVWSAPRLLRRTARWWRSTRAPVSGGGTDPASAAPRGPSGGSWRG